MNKEKPKKRPQMIFDNFDLYFKNERVYFASIRKRSDRGYFLKMYYYVDEDDEFIYDRSELFFTKTKKEAEKLLATKIGPELEKGIDDYYYHGSLFGYISRDSDKILITLE